VADLLPWLSAAAAGLSALVVWGFSSGRWVQRREDDHGDIEALRADAAAITASLTEYDKALRELEQSIVTFRERVNIDVGRLESRLVWGDEKETLRFQRVDEHITAIVVRQDRLEARMNELQRQLDRRRKEES
jgi:hypothetical protein